MSAAKNHRFDVRPILARGEEPFEFLAQLPEPIEAIRAEADALTHLYVAGSYSTLPIPEGAQEALRGFWQRYERLRSRTIR